MLKTVCQDFILCTSQPNDNMPLNEARKFPFKPFSALHTHTPFFVHLIAEVISKLRCGFVMPQRETAWVSLAMPRDTGLSGSYSSENVYFCKHGGQ